MSENIWFHRLFGVLENGPATYQQIQRSFSLSSTGDRITAPNGRKFQCGRFYTPSVQDLRKEVHDLIQKRDVTRRRRCSFQHFPIHDVLAIHRRYPKSVIQAASQFNCLEFPSPRSIPEEGIDDYASDPTQGPACAIACSAGTLYRNYFAPVGDQIGQTENNQINNLDEFEAMVSNGRHGYFYVQNGYVFTSSAKKLGELNFFLENLRAIDLDDYRKVIKIGVQENTEVTFSQRYDPIPEEQGLVTVTQAYCSALSCGYSGTPREMWEPLARLVLEAAYEATILVAMKNALLNEQTAEDNDTFRDVFLTAVGGGVFQNDFSWIGEAIGRAIAVAESYEVDLRIHVCHYRSINSSLKRYVDDGYQKFTLFTDAKQDV